MASLYEQGWRQGSILERILPFEGLRLGPDQTIVRDQGTHDLWIVVTQNCDLDLVDETVEEDFIELRPVFINDPPTDWGIRSRRLLLTNSRYLIAQSRRVMIAPVVLTMLARTPNAVDHTLSSARMTALKTWLGYRYDRPAVPLHYVPLARAIAAEVQRKRHREMAMSVREVLIQFVEGNPPGYTLFAIIDWEADIEEMRLWLSNIGATISPELGLLHGVEVGTADETTLSLIESSFAADVSQLTWRGMSSEGVPGRLS